MRLGIVLLPEAGQAPGPDLTRYLLVCVGSIVALLALAWVFRHTVAGHLRKRAARRSLQVLDVLPLSGKQKLVVVRCYDRSFLLGVGEKEVRSIAELDAPEPQVPDAPPPAREAFAGRLDEHLSLRPAAPRPSPTGPVGTREGLLA